ncbi:hypothetical protein N7532_009623 [Penicillium argentinense]|uniref:Xylanolytic transcriptional activator regulatory domain-containing protein n=1 Tax=Penicillium argentinense TaxID=1131581 RepID=A0A9W9EZV1_9EURO|nr:uncharacterized protein N7532_009623 [Penicillium argentinense]KAJ5090939.1 hypothetical protein N7532_009623 [Penicillium argentinense]
MSLAQKQKPDQFVDFNAGPDANAATGSYDTPPSTNGRDVHGRSPQDTGTLVVKDEGTSYFDSANWRAILEEVSKINGVKDYIGVYDDDSDHEGAEEDVDGDTSPALLLGMSRPISKDELLVDIPPRSIADRLVARFFKTTEPSLSRYLPLQVSVHILIVTVAVHGPTFQREYEQFWKNPQDMSFTWIAYLYAIFALSVSHYHRSEEPLPLNMVDPISIWKTFRKRSAQGLMQSNYLTPGRYKPEALFLYSLTEFYRSQDAQAGVSYLFGILIRLTMRMGYHRDPNHYPSLSPWEGEMRRRLWALVCQLDILISFQVGLPRTIQPWQYDTEQPSNLHDTDFDEATMELPPSRPDSERTACAYTRSKSRIMKVFGQIVDLAFSREQASYDEILSIDRRLQEAHDQLPHFLQYQPIGQCIADPTELIMRRYTLELLYQKSRVVLHRRYMAEPHSKYSYSRSVCLIAARETLRHHSDVYNESLPGGQLYAERFFMSSLQNTDFMLSAMILCLEISQENERENALMGPQERGDLLCLLETTYRIFKETRHRSVDTQRGYAALKIMLGRVKGSPASSDEQNKQIDGELLFQS